MLARPLLALGALALGTLPGCDAVFGLELVDAGAGGDGGGDGGGPDAPPPPCVPAVIVETFDDDDVPNPCGTWADPGGTPGALARAAGALVIAPTGVAVGTCTSRLARPFDDVGLFIEVEQVFGDQERTYFLFELEWSGTTLRFEQKQGRLGAQRDGEVLAAALPYDPVAMRWWRFARRGDAAIALQVAPDARAWRQLAEFVVPVPTEVRIEIMAGTFERSAAPGTVEIGGVGACPP